MLLLVAEINVYLRVCSSLRGQRSMRPTAVATCSDRDDYGDGDRDSQGRPGGGFPPGVNPSRVLLLVSQGAVSFVF